MEKITLEQIDLVMQRSNVSYTDAKEALERTNADVLEAILLLERENKVRNAAGKKCTNDTSKKVKGFFQTLNSTKFKMYKGDTIYINVPSTFAILAILLSFYVSLVVLLIALCYGVKISFVGDNDIAKKANEVVNSFQK